MTVHTFLNPAPSACDGMIGVDLARTAPRRSAARAPQLAFGMRNALPISLMLWAILLSPLLI